MKFIPFSILGVLAAAAVFSQESPNRLERSRIVNSDVAAVWDRAVQLLKNSPAIANTLDAASGVLSFTMALDPKDAKQQLLDADEIEKQPHTVHVTIWVSEAPRGTRIFVRASPNSGVFFTHSNGIIERQILDAIESGTAWITPKKEKEFRKVSCLPEVAWKAASGALLSSPGIIINTADSTAKIVTCSTVIPSGELGKFAAKVKKAIYPGTAHMTLWFEPISEGTLIHMRMLLLELGSLTPVPLVSTERLESAALEALENRMRGGSGIITLEGLNHRMKTGFWSELFSSEAISKDVGGPKLERVLPVSMEKAWHAALRLITQNYVISVCDGRQKRLCFITAHLSKKREGYSSHRVQLTLSPDGEATRMILMIPPAIEPAIESEMEMKAIENRIVTELFFKEQVPWLSGRRN